MCCILAYVIFVPIAKELAVRLDNPSISTATALALGAVASFNLVYPSPVIISAAEELSANTDKLFILGFFIAVLTSTAGYLYARRLGKTETKQITTVQEITAKEKVEIQKNGIEIHKSAAGKPGRVEAYSPIFFPLLLILLKTGFEYPHPILVFLGNPNIALLIGVILSLFSGRTLGLVVLRSLVEKCEEKWSCPARSLRRWGSRCNSCRDRGRRSFWPIFLAFEPSSTFLCPSHILMPFLVAAALQLYRGQEL